MMNVSAAANNPYGQAQMNQAQGNNSMAELLKGMSDTDKTALRDQMQSLPREERLAKQEEMKALDSAGMSDDKYFQTLLDMISQTDSVEEETGFSVYA